MSFGIGVGASLLAKASAARQFLCRALTRRLLHCDFLPPSTFLPQNTPKLRSPRKAK
ncbi:hypothetical protein PTUN_a2698 [Pseudoalteromonas tunicata]|nr:hypothetical protein PTUN_a2698 [Pseudoalteromonas tunicata]